MTKPVLFRPEYAKVLSHIADGDLQTAKTLIASKDPGRLENILYMIQQSVEKNIKAVLILKNTPVPLVHDLGILVALLPVDSYPPGGLDLAALNPFASIRRYEVGEIPLDMDEVQIAFNAAIAVANWAREFLEKKN